MQATWIGQLQFSA